MVRPIPLRRLPANVHGPGFAGLNAEKPVGPGNSDLCFVWPGPIEEAVEHLGRQGVEIVAGPLEGDSGAGGRAATFTSAIPTEACSSLSRTASSGFPLARLGGHSLALAQLTV